MKIPDFDLSKLAELSKHPMIKLAAGDKFIAQVNSVVITAETSKATGLFMLALLEHMADLYEALDDLLSLATPALIGEDKATAQEAQAIVKTLREDLGAKLASLKREIAEHRDLLRN